MPSKNHLMKNLDSKIRSLDGVQRQGSLWAYRTGEREFAHVAREDLLDIRITRSEERRLREAGAPRRIILRAKPSEWISFKLMDPKDVDEAFKLVEIAWKNNGSASSDPKPPEEETKPAKSKRKKKEKDGT